MRLTGAMLFVKDLAAMTAFYRDVLGLHPVEDTQVEDWVEFRDGGAARFSLHAVPAAVAAGIRIESPPRPREQSAARLAFEVQDVEATLAKLEALELPLLRRPWGAIDAVDPEGNVFAVRAATGGGLTART
jgi:catechol 2,3-dioxygenase-like lactoylglutathione lyase family enzyme